MNKNTFYKILTEGSWIEAMKYKDNFIPKVLYKYYPIFDERYADFKKENEDRFNTLSNNNIWVSSYKKFNDPFEFKMLALDKKRLEDNNWEIQKVEETLEMFKERTLVVCFSCDVKINMPLWTHYASNHSGYCIKYIVNDPRNIFPVSYESTRSNTAVIPANMIAEMYKSYDQKLKEPTEEFYRHFSYFYLSLTCKYKFWSYENEYRLLYPWVIPVDGLSVPVRDVGLSIGDIYIGCKCKKPYKEKLMSIGRELKCSVYEMYIDEYSKVYELNKEKLL